MNKPLKIIFIGALALSAIALSSCKNDFDSFNKSIEDVSIEKKVRFEVELPAVTNRSIYYSSKNIKELQITVKKENKVLDSKSAKPGKKLSYEFDSEGEYTIAVKAYNSDNFLIADSEVSKELSFSFETQRIKIKLNPVKFEEYTLYLEPKNLECFEVKLPLKDYLPDATITKDDVIHLSINGYFEDIFYGFEYQIISTAEADGNYKALSDKFKDFAGKDKLGAFSIEKDIPVTVAASGKNEDFYLSIMTNFLTELDNPNGEEREIEDDDNRGFIKFIANIKMSLN